jgi:hypothetical protein
MSNVLELDRLAATVLGVVEGVVGGCGSGRWAVGGIRKEDVEDEGDAWTRTRTRTRLDVCVSGMPTNTLAGLGRINEASISYVRVWFVWFCLLIGMAWHGIVFCLLWNVGPLFACFLVRFRC